MSSAATTSIGLYEAVLIGTGALILILLMLTIYWALRPRRARKISPRQYNAELFKRRMALDEMALELLHDVKIKDGKGKQVAVDHVIRLPSSILLVVSAPPGATAKVKADLGQGEWRYVTPENTVATMLNPVIQLHPLISAIRARFPLVRVRVVAVFPNSADFGPRMPKSCSRAETLLDDIRAFIKEDGPPSATIDTAWPALSAALQQNAGARRGAAA